jgi:excisionase family DNA binding protein
MMYTVRQVAEILGVSRRFVDKARQAGELPFKKAPRLSGTVFQCDRDDLIGWLGRVNFPIDQCRGKLAVGNHLLVCALPPRLVHALSGMRAEFASNAARLGMLYERKPPWAVVMSFSGMGRDTAMEVAADISRDPGRPYLIAIVGEDEATRPGRAADRFDLVLPEDITDVRLKSAIRQLWLFGKQGLATKGQ